jgi:hypothetical protein
MSVRFGSMVLLSASLLSARAARTPSANEFPFEFREGLIWLEVSIPEAAKPLNFLLDSGAGASVISLPTARKLGLTPGKVVSVEGVGATKVGYWPEHLAASVGDVELPKKYLAVDLSEFSAACERPVDGLVGADFFRDRVVKIDFAEQKVRLLPASDPVEGADTLPLKLRKGALRIPVGINGRHPEWLRLDTGCASALQWVTRDAKHSSDSAQVSVALTPISIDVFQTTVQLGKTIFQSVPTGLHAKEIFSGEAGLVGNGLLSSFASVTIDAKAGRLILRK